jgi:hypothetical protein
MQGKAIRIIGDPDNQRPDNWSYTAVNYGIYCIIFHIMYTFLYHLEARFISWNASLYNILLYGHACTVVLFFHLENMLRIIMHYM